MKKFIVLTLLFSGMCSVQADNFFQNTNPFPQTMPQDMNNIYESKPNVINDEAKKAKKSFFKRGKNVQEESTKVPEQYKIPVYPVQHEGAQSTDKFYMFTTD